jgi:ATP-dependent DNA helicase RecQ
MAPDIFQKAVEKLAAQGAAQIDMDGLVRRAPSAPDWRSGYSLQLAHRRSQIDRMVQFAETHQCRMCALIRHFGDTADGHRPCGHCDFCNPSATVAQSFAEPSAAEDRDLRAILSALDGVPSRATGRLFTETGLTKDRKVFDALLDGLARAGLITLTADQWTSPEGKVVPYKKATLTHEGRELASDVGGRAPLGVMLRGSASAATPGRSSAKRASKAASKIRAEDAQPSLTPQQLALEQTLRDWRKAEAAKTGKPAFLVFSDAVLRGLVLAAPRNPSELLNVPGIGPDRAGRYGADLCALCGGRELQAAEPARKAKLAPQPAAVPAPQAVPKAKAAAPAETFTRPRAVVPDPAEALDPAQRLLDQRLRDWRKAESEKIGLPQFFVLGTSTLRNIVLARPASLPQLRTITGMDPEKADRFGASILAICNS